jgi:hypothetical protein
MLNLQNHNNPFQVPRDQASSSSSSEAPAVHSALTCTRASAWGGAWFDPNGAGSAPRLVELCAPAWAGRCVTPGLSLSVGPGIVPFPLLFFRGSSCYCSIVVDCLICKIKIKIKTLAPSLTRDRESSSQLKPAQPVASAVKIRTPLTLGAVAGWLASTASNRRH